MPANYLTPSEAMQLDQIRRFAGPLHECLRFIHATELPKQHRLGLVNTLDLIHDEIHRLKQESAAITD